MAKKFALPDNFLPDFSKAYPNDGKPFTIWVRYEGKVEGKNSVYRWIFAIVVGEVIVKADLFHWSLPQTDFSNEDAANYLANCYQYSDWVEEGQKLTVMRIVPSPVDQSDDEIFILKAMGLVWSIFYSNTVAFPMEELTVDSYSSVLGNKRALIGSKSNPNMSYEVAYSKDKKKTYVTSYVEVDKYEYTDEELED